MIDNITKSFYNFNPRSYKRSDIEYLKLMHGIDISIHAPTRGATITKPKSQSMRRIFQSTLLQEERHYKPN